MLYFDEAVRAAVKLLRRYDRFYFRCVGEWLSLVEHLVRDQGVGGSNPLSPTNIRCSTNFGSTKFSHREFFSVQRGTVPVHSNCSVSDTHLNFMG